MTEGSAPPRSPKLDSVISGQEVAFKSNMPTANFAMRWWWGVTWIVTEVQGVLVVWTGRVGKGLDESLVIILSSDFRASDWCLGGSRRFIEMMTNGLAPPEVDQRCKHVRVEIIWKSASERGAH